MAEITNIPEAMDAIRQLEINKYNDLPAPVQRTLDRSAGLGSSPVDRIVNTAEAIYAHRGEVDQDVRDVAAGLFTIGAVNGWHGLNDDDRAHRAAVVLRGGSEENAPNPAPEFSPAVEAAQEE